jgi:Effector Associated Constant Component 1
MEQADYARAELTVSDQSQFGALREFLGWAAPGIRVLTIHGRPLRSEQGPADLLALLASSSAVVAAIRILPVYLRSRKSALSITITVAGTSVTLTAANAAELIPVLERLLDALTNS